ncbi:hypothetical protein BHM03_00018960 [Ensete ventricosum]|nr:hypothetical protein BHM03_00018960 [Ensete ventricosum]
MYYRSLIDFSELSISVLVLRWSEANQELSLELSPRRDSVIAHEIQPIGFPSSHQENSTLMRVYPISEGSNDKGGGSGIMRSADSSKQRSGGIEEGQRRCFGVITTTGKEEGTRVPWWQRRARSRRRLQRLQRQSKVRALQRGVAMAAREDSSGYPAVMKKRRSRLQHSRAWLRGKKRQRRQTRRTATASVRALAVIEEEERGWPAMEQVRQRRAWSRRQVVGKRHRRKQRVAVVRTRLEARGEGSNSGHGR